MDHLRRSYSVNDVNGRDCVDFATDAGDLNSNVKRLPQIVDVTEELDSDAEPASAPAEPRPRRAARRQTTAAAAGAARGRPRCTARPVSEDRQPPQPPSWQQVQSLEDVSSGYNSGEPFYDAVNRDEDEEPCEEEEPPAAFSSRRAAPTGRSLRRAPLHAPAQRRVKSSAQTDVSGYATLPRSSRRHATRKPIPKYD